eukprot:86425_1
MAQITQALLKEIHEEQLSKGDNNEHNTIQIINIIGGIDKILTNYDKITEFKSTQENYQSNKRSNNMSKLVQHKDVIDLEDDNRYLFFKSSNTYLSYWFAPKTETLFNNFIHNRIVQSILLLSFIIYYYLLFTMYLTVIYPIFIISINCVLWIPYSSLWILSSNR